MSLSVGVLWRVGNTKLLKYKNLKNIKTFQFVDMYFIIYMKITPVFFGDRLLLQVVVLVDCYLFLLLLFIIIYL
jgi:hypothetical protein